MFPAAASADPTTGGRDERGGQEVKILSGPSPISRVSSKAITDNFTCTTTPKELIGRPVNVPVKSDVVVHFQGEFFPGCRALISLTRNNVIVPGPGDGASPMAAHDTNGELSTNGFNWVIKGVPPGNHAIRVLCECISGTTLVDERSLIIYHR
jgi:hypothetical protein